jgi:hypothetical protein
MEQNLWLGNRLGTAILAGSVAIIATAAAADVRVLQSDLPEIQKSTVLTDDAVLDIPAKKKVRVLLMPANVTKVIAGPYKGTAQDYVPPTGLSKKGDAQFDAATTVNAPPPFMRNLQNQMQNGK